MISFNQFQKYSKSWQFMVENNIDLFETIYRPGSPAYFEFLSFAKKYLNESVIFDEESEFLQTDIGEFGIYEGQEVPLDFPMVFLEKAEYDGKEVELDKPKRGGSKKFYVYVRDPKTKNIKKVEFGDTSGLKIDINNPKARKSFAARHKCSEKKDKTKPGYWSCRLPRYHKSLGIQADAPGEFW